MTKTQLFENDLQEKAMVFKVLSHPARLAILKYLAGAKVCISGDISEELPLSRTTVHQHLSELKKLDIVKGEITGIKTNYCLNTKKIQEIKDSLDTFLAELAYCTNNNCKKIAMKILILCTGNSCRSQMAHGFLQSFDSRLTVCSAGTEASGKLNENAVKAMTEIGIDISHHTSDSVDKYLKDEWDYVITVCGGANEVCPAFLGKVKNRLHMGFDDPSHATGNEEYIWSEFIRVRNEIKTGFSKFYNEQIKPQL